MINKVLKPKIVIIDDSLYDRFIYKSLLGESDYEFIEFNTGNEFLKACGSLVAIKLIILDGILPDNTCNEIVDVIIKQKIVASNKILLCTGLSNLTEKIKELPNEIIYLSKDDLLADFKKTVLHLLSLPAINY